MQQPGSTDRLQKCRICHERIASAPIIAKEMMLGIKDEHRYYQCSGCGCVQIDNYPQDIAKYYPPNYYSFTEVGRNSTAALPERVIRQLRRWVALRTSRRWQSLWYPASLLPLFYRVVGGKNITKSSRILDLGCGSGGLLRFLMKEGFTKVEGMDPFAPITEVEYSGRRAPIHRDWDSCGTGYDLIHACRSVEHMPDQRQLFSKLINCCNKGGIIALVIPVVGYGWRVYRENWVQLDAPRHYYIHTRKSIERLLQGEHASIEAWRGSSTEFLFWGSEQYRKGVPLAAHDLNRGIGISTDANKLFTKNDINQWRRRARQLNRAGDSDEAIILIRCE